MIKTSSIKSNQYFKHVVWDTVDHEIFVGWKFYSHMKVFKCQSTKILFSSRKPWVLWNMCMEKNKKAMDQYKKHAFYFPSLWSYCSSYCIIESIWNPLYTWVCLLWFVNMLLFSVLQCRIIIGVIIMLLLAFRKR